MSGTVSSIIIAVILIVTLFFAIKNSIPHFRGEGGCCGGSCKEKIIKPVKIKNVIATKVVHIEGMRCENCHRRVQNALNSIEGVNAKINGDKKQALVKMDRNIDDSEIEKAITGMGYSVTEIKTV
jgi:copper chaperone CopZ